MVGVSPSQTPDPIRNRVRFRLLLLAAGAFAWVALLGDVAIAGFERDALLLVEFGVARPLRGHVGFAEDRLDGALGHARFAVDAVVRVDVQHHFVLVETFDRTDDAAIGVFTIVAVRRHNMSHVNHSLNIRRPRTLSTFYGNRVAIVTDKLCIEIGRESCPLERFFAFCRQISS